MGDRILVIEDEANIADYLVRGLREEGFAVEHAGDGAVGLASYRSRGLGPGPARLVVARRGWARIPPPFPGAGSRTPVLFLTARDPIRIGSLA